MYQLGNNASHFSVFSGTLSHTPKCGFSVPAASENTLNTGSSNVSMVYPQIITAEKKVSGCSLSVPDHVLPVTHHEISAAFPLHRHSVSDYTSMLLPTLFWLLLHVAIIQQQKRCFFLHLMFGTGSGQP